MNQLLLQMHNQARLERQLQPLEAHAGLLLAADQHAKYMNSKRRLTHYGPWFSGVGSRVARHTTDKYLTVAENIAWNPSSFASVFDQWMDSPRHRQNILRANVTHMAWSYSGSYHCAVFARFST
jgi:uncharacterized protein YkwD